MDDIKIAKLVSNDGWTLWKFQMKVLLRASNLWEIVNGTTEKPTGEAEDSWMTKDAKAQKILVVSLGEEPLMHIINCDTSAEMYAALESVYEQKSQTSVHLLQQQFFQYTKNPEDSIAMHVAKLQKISRQLQDLGEKISENMLVTKILMTLPEQYNHFFASWEATGIKERTLKTLTARLCMEESRLNVQPIKQEAFAAKRDQHVSHHKKQLKGKCFLCKKFGSYTAFDKAQDVWIAYASVLPAYVKGVIAVEAYDGNAWNIKFLTNVLYVPDTKHNLFSSSVC